MDIVATMLIEVGIVWGVILIGGPIILEEPC